MMARRIAAETPNAILADQFYNQANPDAHYALTGPELWEQTEGRITHFVGGAGTGGTITGVGRFLKEKNPNIKVSPEQWVGDYYQKLTVGIAGNTVPDMVYFQGWRWQKLLKTVKNLP